MPTFPHSLSKGGVFNFPNFLGAQSNVFRPNVAKSILKLLCLDGGPKIATNFWPPAQFGNFFGLFAYMGLPNIYG